ncbi:MAG TPA: flavodoxin domain-containing protein [Blattabacteriaceae bacterium]
MLNKTFLKLVLNSSKEEIIWMHGYLSGFLDHHFLSFSLNKGYLDDDSYPKKIKITLAYGSESGNSKKLAIEFSSKIKSSGFQVKLTNLDNYRVSDFEKETYFFVIISTYGDGEPPDSAKDFFNLLLNKKSPELHHIKYAVLALGDRSYTLFCKAGEDLDSHLESLGAQRYLPLKKCDVDFYEEAKEWMVTLLSKIKFFSQKKFIEKFNKEKKYGTNFFFGKVQTNIILNDIGSEKQTHHIEISLNKEELRSKVGDALGVFPENPLDVVEDIIKISNIKFNKNIKHPVVGNVSIFTLLKKRLNIFFLPKRIVKKYAELIQKDIPNMRMDFLDILKNFPLIEPEKIETFIKILEPIIPRLYSISSSPEAQDGEIHLTVEKNIFLHKGKIRYGICSNQLSLLKKGDNLKFYIKPNNFFKLPPNDKDIILISAGTGFSPFRAFLLEREITASSGRNWLFFGNRSFETDFLYQTEIKFWVEIGILNRVNLAFSREKKIYVQQKMWKYKTKFFEWIDSGAYLYVCGKKKPMSLEVEKTIFNIIEEKKGEFSKIYFNRLKERGHYLKDVY